MTELIGADVVALLTGGGYAEKVVVDAGHVLPKPAGVSIVDAAEKLDMPDPEQAAAAVDLMMRTLFDVFRDTRMEEHAADLAWGFVNSFHMVAKRVEGREDDAAKKLGEMARAYDPSEIYATELEETQLLCQTLEGNREALALGAAGGALAAAITRRRELLG